MKKTSHWRNIRRARIDARVSQVRLAKVLGKSQRWVSGLERGHVQITAAVAEKIVEKIWAIARSRYEEVLRSISES